MVEHLTLTLAAADQDHATTSGGAGEIAGFLGVGKGDDRGIEGFAERRALATGCEAGEHTRCVTGDETVLAVSGQGDGCAVLHGEAGDGGERLGAWQNR